MSTCKTPYHILPTPWGGRDMDGHSGGAVGLLGPSGHSTGTDPVSPVALDKLLQYYIPYGCHAFVDGDNDHGRRDKH